MTKPGRSRSIFEINVKMDLKERGFEWTDRIMYIKIGTALRVEQDDKFWGSTKGVKSTIRASLLLSGRNVACVFSLGRI
jgi:hypothetical protein